MNLHNQFANLDYRKTPIEADLPPKLKRARSLSTKILKHSPLLPRLDSRASSRHKSRRQEHAEHGRKPSRAEGDYKAYLQYPHYVQRPNQLATMPTTLVSSFSKVIISPLGCIPEYPTISISHRPDKSARQQLQRQKQKSPIKYKILAELGYTDEAIVQMTEAEQRQLQDEYLRNKGKEYLRESRLRIKIDHICHPREEEKEQKRLPSYSPNRDKNYVREIFKEVSQAARIREQARELVRREKLHEEMKLKRLKQCEDALGNYVYRRVAKHLRASHKQKLNFFQQVKGEAKVDEALINFIKFKIKRIHTTLQ